MERRDPQRISYDGGFNTLIFQDDLHSEEDQVHCQPNQNRKKELMFYVGPGRRSKLAAVSLMGLASVLLIVDIGLGVHYNKLTDTHLTFDDIDLISKDLAQLQDTYKTSVKNMNAAQKQADREKSLQTETKWELEHQNKRSEDYDVQIEKVTKDVATMRSYLPMITDGCRHCPSGWLLMNSVCIYFAFLDNTGLKTWQKAREFCQLYGGDLLIIDSKDKENATVNHVLDHQGSSTSSVGFWFGLKDSQEEGTWKWVDGSFLVEGYWMDEEPNDTDNEDCAELYPEENFFKAWNDAKCNTQRKWICQKALNLMS